MAETAATTPNDQAAPAALEQSGEKPSRLTLVLQRFVGEKRAPEIAVIVVALWPFMRLLMGILAAVMITAVSCYLFESRRTYALGDITFGDDGNASSLLARRTFRTAEGEVILPKGESFTEEAVKNLETAGYTSVPVVDHTMYSDVGDAVWWGFVTLTTVGYGDRFPKTQGGRFVGVLLMFASIVLISSFTATASSVLVARRIQEQQRERSLEWSGHIVFCGWNEMAPRILRVLDAQTPSPSKRQVIFLNERTEEAMELQMRGYDHLEIRFVRGNFIREEDLNRANVRQAATVIIVPDSTDGRQPDEQKTFEATTMIKDIAPQVKVYAHVLDSERVANLRRANVDDVVVTNEYVGELVAGFVTKSGVTQAVRTLVSLEGECEFTVIPIPAEFNGRPISDFADQLRSQARTILVGIVAEVEGVGLESAMRGGDQYIVELIREEIAKAGIKTQTQGSKTHVTLNPENDHVIQTTDMALVIRNRRTQAT